MAASSKYLRFGFLGLVLCERLDHKIIRALGDVGFLFVFSYLFDGLAHCDSSSALFFSLFSVDHYSRTKGDRMPPYR